MAVRETGRPRTLQPDELSDLIDGAALIDAGGYSPTTDRIGALRGQGHPIAAIADATGVAVPTVYYHLGKPRRDGEVGEGRSLLTLLGYAGLRISEALALRARYVRLHAAPRRLDVLDAKTPTGIREVHLSPKLADVLTVYLERRGRDGAPGQDDAFLWTANGGGARSYRWALNKFKRAATVASERRMAHGLPPLPAVTPHSLRHTYISILLLGTDNVPYVMEQVGHDDEATTTRIYRHLIRQRQEHGVAFDDVVARAREDFGGHPNRR